MEVVFVVLWLFFSIAVGAFASQRGRSGIGWVLLSIITSPLLALIIVLLMADLAAQAADRERESRRHEEQMAALTSGNARVAVSNAEPSNASVVANAQPVLVADELGKLATLRDRGLLTEEEFLLQKGRLLGASTSTTKARMQAPVQSQARKTPTEELTTIEKCKVALSALGGKVLERGPGVWEVSSPTGGTTEVHSLQELISVYERF